MTPKLFNCGYKQLIFNGVLYREDNYIVAHCLQLDIVGTSPNSEIEAIDKLLELIEVSVIHALETNDLVHLFKAAPRQYWDMALTAQKEKPDAN